MTPTLITKECKRDDNQTLNDIPHSDSVNTLATKGYNIAVQIYNIHKCYDKIWFMHTL